MILQSLQFAPFWANGSISCEILETMVSCDIMVHIGDEDIVVALVYFECGTTFYPDDSTKVQFLNRDNSICS